MFNKNYLKKKLGAWAVKRSLHEQNKLTIWNDISRILLMYYKRNASFDLVLGTRISEVVKNNKKYHVMSVTSR